MSVSLDDPSFFTKINSIALDKFNQEQMSRNIEEENTKAVVLDLVNQMLRQCVTTKTPLDRSIGLAKLYQDAILSEIEKTRKDTASEIFNLAHQYASEDKTMVGCEELRSYHYLNAIRKVGNFPVR